MKHKIIFSIVIFLFIVSCDKSKDLPVLILSDKEVEFNVGYNTARLGGNIFYSNNKEYFYFFNNIYTDYVSIFDNNGIKVDSINIGKLKPKNDRIIRVIFLNSDTIIFITKSSFLYAINRNLKILNVIELWNNKSLGIDSSYEVDKNINMINDTTALFSTSYNNLDNPYKQNDNYCDHIRYYVKHAYKSKRLLFIRNLFSDSLKTKHTLSNFEYVYTDSNHFSMPLHYFYVKTPYIFIFNIYTNKVFIYSIPQDSIISSFEVTSYYSDSLFTPPFLIKGDCLRKLDKNSYTEDKGMLSSMYYSDYTKSYYVLIRIPANSKKEQKRYSIIRLDKNFKKLGESKLFNLKDIMWTQKGVYISENKKVKHIQKTLKYKFYEFSK